MGRTETANGLLMEPRDASPIGLVAERISPLTPADMVAEALRRFRLPEGFIALPVVDQDGIPVGIIHKSRLLALLGQKYGYALYGNKPVSEVMESPLVFESHTPLETASLQAVARDKSHIYDAVLVVQDGGYLGTVQVYDILACITRRTVQRMQEESSFSVALLRVEDQLRLHEGTEEVCRAAIRAIPQMFPGCRAYIWRWEDETASLRPSVASDEMPAEVSRILDTPRRIGADLEKAMRSARPLVFEDDMAGPSDPDLRYFMLLSLRAGGTPLGVMLATLGGEDLSETRLERMQEIADKVALSMLGEQSREDLTRRLADISLLNQITKSMAHHLDLESIYQVIVQRMEEDFRADLACVCRYEEDSSTIRVLKMSGATRELAATMGLAEGSAIPLDQVSIDHAMSGRTDYIADMTQTDDPMSRQLRERGIMSLVVIPLTDEGVLMGILVLGRREKDAFRPPERSFLEMLGEQVSLAVHQARLYLDLRMAFDEIRRTQQEMMTQERLRALGQMASGIAHDINNLLSPIVGYSELLLYTEEKWTEQERHWLEVIRRTGQDIAMIVTRMREFYRKRDHQDPLIPVNLNSMAMEAVEMTRPRWKDMPQRKGVVLRVDPDLDMDLPEVPGIPSEIREAIINLILNAVDAMQQGGTVTIRTGVASDTVRLEVIDQGIGMDEDTRMRCMEPFFSTKGEHGTGLGLASVFGTMKRHEGSIQVESEPGRGTTVRLHFPLPVPASHRLPPSPGRPDSSHGRAARILCIDDDNVVLRVVRTMLASGGHEVTEASGGRQGIDAFRKARDAGEPFDVVITDLGMPHVDGKEVARILKGEVPGLPIILLTGWGSQVREEGSFDGLVDRVLSKPPEMKEIRAALRELVPSSDPPPFVP